MTDAGQASSTKTVTPPKAPRIELRELLQGARMAVIVHDGQEYRLTLTSNDKLILTK